MTGRQRLLASLRLLSICLTVTFALSHLAHAAATLTMVNLDEPGEGFNDPTSFTPVGGNMATTLGEARLNALQFAADIWGAVLTSSVPIVIGANFDSLGGTAFSATLGSAGAETFIRDFSGAPLASTWYPVALANSLAGMDLDPGDNDIGATFNSDVDGEVVLGTTRWYYGLDGNPPVGDLDFVHTALHEIGHGLGFVTLVNLSTGAKALGFNDAYMLQLEHHGATPPDYPSMTNAQRVAASVAGANLHWTGSNVVAASGSLVAGVGEGGHVEMYAPDPAVAGSSVSHFSTSLSPDELMEPFATATQNVGLTEELFTDLGWSVETSPTLSVSPSSQDFGSVTVGSSADQTFAVNNAGGSTLTGSASTDAPFSIVSGSSFSLEAGQSQSVTARFSPDSAGIFAGTVSFSSNGGSTSATVTGIGVSAEAGYTEVSGNGLTPNSPVTVVEGSTLHLFVRGADDRVYINTRTEGTWSGYSEVPGGGLTLSQPGAVLDSSGNLRLYVRGTDNRVYVNTRTGSTWSGYSEVAGGGLTLSGPEAVLDGSEVQLFVRGADDRVYTITP